MTSFFSMAFVVMVARMMDVSADVFCIGEGHGSAIALPQDRRMIRQRRLLQSKGDSKR